MNEKLNVETGAELPFSNGTVERHNMVLMEAMTKTREDVKCDPETALAWVVSAKNALANHNGYSPNQLVFGFNTNIPNVLTDSAPALEENTISDIIRNNMNDMHTARENMIKAGRVRKYE